MFRIIIFLFLVQAAFGQVTNTATMDTTDYSVKGRMTIEGYLDAYYAYNFNKPPDKNQPYLISMARHNEANINLAFIDLKYSSERVRSRIATGFGTYMNNNYNDEQGTLKNLVEANAGYRIGKRQNIWIDFGVLGSPYTNESAVSKDHLAYTRSLGAENVPYYLAGLKLTLPVSKTINSYFYIVNGWQQISDQHSGKAVGTQLEIKPNKYLLVNWNTFFGREKSAIDSAEGMRVFTDMFLIYTRNNWSVTGSAYIGRQGGSEVRWWWQANTIARYRLTQQIALSGRAEYFQDDFGVLVLPINKAKGFRTFGGSLGLDLSPDSNILIRAEVRRLFSQESIFERAGNAVRQSYTITGNICVWF